MHEFICDSCCQIYRQEEPMDSCPHEDCDSYTYSDLDELGEHAA